MSKETGTKLWRDMSELERANVHPETLNDPTNPLQIPWGEWTREAKGALLLSHNEGVVVEYRSVSGESGKAWPAFYDINDDWVYILRTEPVRETVELWWRKVTEDECSEGRIGTIDLIDGKPDCDSIKMEEL